MAAPRRRTELGLILLAVGMNRLREVRVEPVQFENGVVGETETNWLFFARG